MIFARPVGETDGAWGITTYLEKGQGGLCVDGEAGLCYNKISKNLGRSIPAGWSVMG